MQRERDGTRVFELFAVSAAARERAMMRPTYLGALAAIGGALLRLRRPRALRPRVFYLYSEVETYLLSRGVEKRQIEIWIRNRADYLGEMGWFLWSWLPPQGRSMPVFRELHRACGDEVYVYVDIGRPETPPPPETP
jgi:hypothetical protein